MPHASPRVGANVEAILNEGVGVFTAFQEIVMGQLLRANDLSMFSFATSQCDRQKRTVCLAGERHVED